MAGEEYDPQPTGATEDVRMPDGPGQSARPGESDQIRHWLKKIEGAKKHHAKAFERIKKCQQIAAHGAYKEWLDNEWRYVVPVVNRLINQAVANLYAKNPTAVAERRKRLLHTVWDGTQEQIIFTTQMAKQGDINAMITLQAIQADIAQAQAAENMTERAAETLTLLYEYQIQEQPMVFKTKLKQLVRRTKVNGVSFLKANFLREMDMRPETAAMMEDTQAKLRTIRRLMEDTQNGETYGDGLEAKALELESLLADTVKNPDRVVREQLMFDYPRTTEIIIDPCTRDIKTLEGCGWLAHEFNLTCDQIRDIYGVDIEKMKGAEYTTAIRMLETDAKPKTYRLYEVQNKYTQQVFTIAEGVDIYLKPPAEPDVWFEGFFNIFPLVFNEVEHDDELYPPSDVWNARHMQFEYNRSREALREHRIAARPWWLTVKGRFEQSEKERIKNHAAHEIVEINPPPDARAPISASIERGPTAPVDPNLYDTSILMDDLLKSVGAQEANIGGMSGATATESSIAESSRMTTEASNVDDLDDFLTLVARVSGQILLQSLTKERVVEIVGPGAVWPELPLTRKQLADEITLSVKAGSSGRPNQAAKLANLERAWPAISMMPNLSTEPIAEAYMNLLDIDFAAASRPGAMSIVAQNAMAKPAAVPPGQAPEAQGGNGASNDAPPSGGEPTGAQPMYPGNGDPNQPTMQ
jgi:hypothetical protein